MSVLLLHEFHQTRRATFTSVNRCEAVASYGDSSAEYLALTTSSALLDLSFRGRVCLLGSDREKFLHGQVTNDILRLKTGQGCYAALLSPKAKMESDLFVFKLNQELLLDFEPGLTDRLIERLNRYVIAEDVQVVDVAPHYGLLTLAGPDARATLERSALGLPLPNTALSWQSLAQPAGEIYIVNNPRFKVPAYDIFVPTDQVYEVASTLDREINGRWAGWEALETVRIENAVPRFGIDMTESTIPQEAELQHNGISFSKGCYIGQEIVARIRTYGQVAKALRLLRVNSAEHLPAETPVFAGEKPVGVVTSAVFSPKFQAIAAFAYVRKEHFAPGTPLQVGDARLEAEIVAVPGVV